MVGVILGAVALWMLGDGLTTLLSGAKTADLVEPILKIVGALVIAGIYYWSLWAESAIRTNLENIFSIPELIGKIAFTLALLCIYRIGYHVPLPGLNQAEISKFMSGQATGTFGQALEYFGMFTGGNLQQSTLFGLGIMPYISASIILQLLVTVWPALQKLQKEGPAGQRKIQEYTRYGTVFLCLVQAIFWMKLMNSQNLLYAKYQGDVLTFVTGVIGLTAGTMFLMWLGEQIDAYGIGNGISLIIMAGIVDRLPWAIRGLAQNADLSLGGLGSTTAIGLDKIVFLIASFLFVVAGSILITQGQRRIPIQQAKHTRGRRVYGGQRQYLPLRVNHGGVMPIIFASSLMIFPGVLFGYLSRSVFPNSDFFRILNSAFSRESYTYIVCYVGLIYFFAYFWTTVQFRPKEMAEQLRDYGTFIPGLRPGKRTAEYLERVMERITYCGAGFLSVIAVIPMVVSAWLGIPFNISAFLGGTGLLIMVSVTLDLVQRIEANLVMRNYGGFLGGSTRIKGAYA
ncbi:MAG TPA: preprotein translocase subunit SecY [Phycisphaerae bacterium]|nr:preprotein translocase subunit SecY [Phycisphaerae bacterium]HQL72860.1 preprotein translocase subunit SecY [Phycisphaerae bacterium]